MLELELLKKGKKHMQVCVRMCTHTHTHTQPRIFCSYCNLCFFREIHIFKVAQILPLLACVSRILGM